MLPSITVLSLITPFLATLANAQGYTLPPTTGSVSCDLVVSQLAQYWSKGVTSGSISLDSKVLYQCLISVPSTPNTRPNNTAGLRLPSGRPSGMLSTVLPSSRACVCPTSTSSSTSARSTSTSTTISRGFNSTTTTSRSTVPTGGLTFSQTRASSGLLTPTFGTNGSLSRPATSTSATSTRVGTTSTTSTSTTTSTGPSSSSTLVTFKGAGSILTPTNLLASLSIIIGMTLLS